MTASNPGTNNETSTISYQCHYDDFGGSLTPYYRKYRVTLDSCGTVETELLGTFTTNDGTDVPYAIQGDALDPSETGTSINVEHKAGSLTIEGPVVFKPIGSNGLLNAVSATAIGDGVQLEDCFGNISKLRDGQTKTWGSPCLLPLIAPKFTVPVGAELDIWWTEPNI